MYKYPKSMIVRLREMGTDRVWVWLDLACFSFLFINLLVTENGAYRSRK